MALIHVPVGFLPLLDSVLIVLAREQGFAEEEGLDLQLIKETSWANIRDRIAVGHFDAAQMLAPMPIASGLRLTPLDVAVITPMMLGLGNNAVTVSAGLWQQMAAQGAPGDLAAGPAGGALARVVTASDRKLKFGVVHQTSSHNYELRYWLAASGIRPDAVEIVVLPPRLLPDALESRTIDGYCVGEPWNSVAVDRAGAHIATVKASIWRSSPDKVIGMRSDWAREHPDTVAGLIRAVHAAALCARTLHTTLKPHNSSPGPATSTIPPSWYGALSRDACTWAADQFSRSPISLFPSSGPPTSHGRAMRSGTTPRWSAGGG